MLFRKIAKRLLVSSAKWSRLFLPITKAGQKRLRILNFHDVPSADFGAFESLLDMIKESGWQIITPAEFELAVIGQKELTYDAILITFDDGFQSNRKLAEEVLSRRKIKAIFFVITGFVDCDVDDVDSFIANRLYPGDLKSEIPKGLSNLTWDDVARLCELGHTIGSHTATHAALAEISSDDLIAEIASCKSRIQEVLGCEVNHFAFPFGDERSISSATLDTALRFHKFLYTGYRGDNFSSPLRSVFFRDTLQIYEPPDYAAAILRGVFDFRHANRRNVLKKYLRDKTISSHRPGCSCVE